MLVGILLLDDCVLIENKSRICLYSACLWGTGAMGVLGRFTYLKSELDHQTRACIAPTHQAYFSRRRTRIQFTKTIYFTHHQNT